MPREQTDLTNISFAKGLITETGPLGYPENSFKESSNITIERNGSVRVRNGLTAMAEDSYIDTGTDPDNISSVLYWENPAEDGTSFIVVVFKSLGFISCYPITSTGIDTNNPINAVTMTTGGGFAGLGSFSSKSGGFQQVDKLFINSVNTTGSGLPGGMFYLKYMPNGNMNYDAYSDVPNQYLTNSPFVGVFYIPLAYRDLQSSTSPFPLTYRPATYAEAYPDHVYNLLNTGWQSEAAINRVAFEGDTNLGRIPAIGDFWIYGWVEKRVYEVDPSAIGTHQHYYYEHHAPSETPPPAGRYILRLDAVQPRYLSSGVDTTGSLGVVTGPTSTAFFAGRIWYAGFKGREFEDNVMFSQVLPYSDTEGCNSINSFNEDYGKCYQEADPTDRYINDIVASDGGVIPIPGVGKVQNIIALATGVVVISTTGSWFITGGIDPFSATNYSVSKITNVGCVSQDSVVEIPNGVLFWSDGGIVALLEQTAGLSPTSLTDQTIKTFYENIPYDDKVDCKGGYDRLEDKIYWFYGNGKCLVFDTVLECFYTYDFGQYYDQSGDLQRYNDLDLRALNILGGFLPNNKYIWVYYRRELADDGHYYILFYKESDKESGNYTDYQPNYLSNPDYRSSYRPYSPINAYVEIGATNFGGLMRGKQVFRVFSYFETTEYRSAPIIDGMSGNDLNLDDDWGVLNDSYCYVQGRWEWASRGISGKWTAFQAAYKRPKIDVLRSVNYPSVINNADPLFTNNIIPIQNKLYEISEDNIAPAKEVTVTRMRMRGTGKVLNLRFENEEAKGFHLLGWAAPALVETRP